ncbi:hypothetical protein KAH81_07305 [bacterium]|nr:hypothetical protein [bacterium]
MSTETGKVSILNDESLALTLWNLELARLTGTPNDKKLVNVALNWIIKRQKDPGRYGLGFAAPTEEDYRSAILPTGEKLNSRAGTAHLLGEEALWALSKWLGPGKNSVREGLLGMLGRARRFRAYSDRGRYCCTTCSLSLWRALAASEMPEGMPFLERGLTTLSLSRDGKLGWKGFQFAYTIFALASLEHTLADSELIYAGGRIERALKLLRISRDPYGLRRLGYEAALKRI